MLLFSKYWIQSLLDMQLKKKIYARWIHRYLNRKIFNTPFWKSLTLPDLLRRRSELYQSTISHFTSSLKPVLGIHSMQATWPVPPTCRYVLHSIEWFAKKTLVKRGKKREKLSCRYIKHSGQKDKIRTTF